MTRSLGLINKIPAKNVTQYKTDGAAVDGAQVVVDYLKTRTANPVLNRIQLLAPLPSPKYNNPELQPLQGVSP